jgi:hypothetical protein
LAPLARCQRAVIYCNSGCCPTNRYASHSACFESAPSRSFPRDPASSHWLHAMILLVAICSAWPWIEVGRAAVRHEAATRNFLFSRYLVAASFDHGSAVVAGVPVGRDLPILAVPGLDASGACALVILAGDVNRLQHAFETERRSLVMSRLSRPQRTCSPVWASGRIALTRCGSPRPRAWR